MEYEMRILETAIYADDLEASAAFYCDVLGLEKIAEVSGRHVFFRADRGVLLVFAPSATIQPTAHDARLPVPPHGATGPGHVCFAAAAGEFPDWVERLQAAGVEIEADFEWPQGGRSIYFRDPAGNSLEFAEPRTWGID